MTKDKIDVAKEDEVRIEQGKSAIAIAGKLFGAQTTVEGELEIAKLLSEVDGDEEEEQLAVELRKCVALASGMWNTEMPTAQMVLGLHKLWFYRTTTEQLDDVEDALEELKEKITKRK